MLSNQNEKVLKTLFHLELNNQIKIVVQNNQIKKLMQEKQKRLEEMNLVHAVQEKNTKYAMVLKYLSNIYIFFFLFLLILVIKFLIYLKFFLIYSFNNNACSLGNLCAPPGSSGTDFIYNFKFLQSSEVNF